MSALTDRTVIMSGGSRGIGLAIAKKAAAEGANVAIIAKTDQPHPKLEGTVHTAAAEIEEAGDGGALAIVGDVRDEESVAGAVAQTVERFGGIDIVVNNASAINLAPMRDLPVKRLDLMLDINLRGTFVLTQAALPHLRESDHAHVLSPVAAAVGRPQVAARPLGLHGGQVRHDDGHAGRGRRRGRGPDRGQHAVAAHADRHGGGAEPAGRRRGDGPGAHARRSTPTRRWRSSSATRASAPATRSSTTRCWPRRA